MLSIQRFMTVFRSRCQNQSRSKLTTITLHWNLLLGTWKSIPLTRDKKERTSYRVTHFSEKAFTSCFACCCLRKVTVQKQKTDQHPPYCVSNQSVSVIFQFDVKSGLRVFPWLFRTEQRSLVIRAFCQMTSESSKWKVDISVKVCWLHYIYWQEATRTYQNTVNRGKTKLSEVRSRFSGQWIEIITLIRYDSTIIR